MRSRQIGSLVFPFVCLALFSCGEEEDPHSHSADYEAEGYVFTLREDEGGYFVSDYKGGAKEIVIPDSVNDGENDIPIVGIDGFAFHARKVTTVELGNNVRVLSPNSFTGSNIDTLYVTASLREVSVDSFASSKIKSEFIDGVQYLKSRDCPTFFAVYADSSKSELKIADGCYAIGNGVFRESKATVELPSSIRHIGSDNFTYDGAHILANFEEIVLDELHPYMFTSLKGSLKKIRVNGDVKTLESQMFTGCGRIESLILPETIESIHLYSRTEGLGVAAAAYTKIDDLYYVGSEEKPNLYCIGTFNGNGPINAKIAEGTVLIADSAFSTSEIWSMVLPNGLLRIGRNAFSSCKSLRSVFLPSSLISVPSSAFSMSESLEIYTADQEEDIKWNKDWNESAKRPVHYGESFTPFPVVAVRSNLLYYDKSSETLTINMGGLPTKDEAFFSENGTIIIDRNILSRMLFAVKKVELSGALTTTGTQWEGYGQRRILVDEDWDSEIPIRLNSLSLTSSPTYPAIEAKADAAFELVGSNSISSAGNSDFVMKGKKISLTGTGSLKVTGMDGNYYGDTADRQGDGGISCSDLSIAGVTLTVVGGHGASAYKTGAAGAAGCEAIRCGNISLSDGAQLIATGGKGGYGMDGQAATSQTTSNGKNGGAGGKGGTALYCDSLAATADTRIYLTGGDGGSGGDGGNGTTATGASSNGTNGGKGGDGGHGMSASSISVLTQDIKWAGGKGGAGGSGGSKGDAWLGMQFGKDGADGKSGAEGLSQEARSE